MDRLTVDWRGERRQFDQYLEAIGIVDASARDALFETVFPEAREMVANGDPRPQGQVLCGLLLAALTRRFREVLQSARLMSDAEVFQEGRMALRMADLTPSRQRAFAAMDQPVDDGGFLAELRKAHRLAGPQSKFAELMPAPLELGPLPRLADTALSELDRAPALRMAVLWLVAAAFFGGLFFLTR